MVLTLDEIEQLFLGVLSVFPDPTHSRTEVRFKAVGRTAAGRHVFVVFTLREGRAGRLARPISARYMHRREIDRHEREAAAGAEQ